MKVDNNNYITDIFFCCPVTLFKKVPDLRFIQKYSQTMKTIIWLGDRSYSSE